MKILDDALPPKSKEEIMELITNKDYETVIRTHIPLVLKIAKDYRDITSHVFDDLIQEGCLGVLRACEMYDASKNSSFTNYAALWIKQRLGLLLAKAGIIKVPLDVYTKARAVSKKASKLGRDLSLEEIMETTNSTYVKSKTIDRVLKFLVANDNSLNKMPHDYKPAHLKQLKESLSFGWNCLNGKEKFIVTKRFGLNGHKVSTYRELGIALNKTGERVRQIQDDALTKLKPYLQEHIQ